MPGRTVATQEVESSLRASFEVMLQGGEGAAARQLAAVEASLWQTFQALPKNTAGRLAPRAVRYIVHNYFNKEHGWLIKGLEPHGMQENVSDVHEVSILQDRAPAFVEALLEARQSERGLSLNDVVVMVAALERLIFEESTALLQAAYTLNGFSSGDAVDETSLHNVLTSYLLIFEMGSKGNLSDAQVHQVMKASAAKAGGSWPALVEYGEDALLNFGFARRHSVNPFVERQYSFEEASHVVEDLAQGYGKWQNTECRRMKEELMELGSDGSGRVPLAAFYSQPENADYQFTESLDYLRQIGALDESVGAPWVRIANYLVGPSNCIASSTYYSVCCLSECEGLMNELEGAMKSPTAAPERLLAVVGNLSSSSVDAPRALSQDLEDKLHAISERHSGEVPLHGRLFAQWLHFAFPNECPYPHVAENAAALTPSHWLDGRATARPEERRQQASSDRADSTSAAEQADPLAQWSDLEVLPAHEVAGPRFSVVRAAVRLAMQLALLLVVARLGSSAWQAARNDPLTGKAGRLGDGLALPL